MGRKYRCHGAAALGYVPAEVHFAKTLIYIDLYAAHPITKEMKRKRYKVNRVKGAAARRSYARDMCSRLNDRLREGWNPWADQLPEERPVTLKEALEKYLHAKTQTTTNRSPNSYRSHVRIFSGWAKSQGLLDLPASGLTGYHGRLYMAYIRDVRQVNPTTYNNYHLFATGIFNWMIEEGWLLENPLAKVKRLRKVQKLRTVITATERKQCMEWFMKHQPPMVLVCMWVFHTLLRPRSELMRIRAKDVDLVKGVVTVDGVDTKSKRVRKAAIPPSMLKLLRASTLATAAPSDYVVGKGLVPSPEQSGYNYIGLSWNKMRKALGWTADKQLYSMRDSGIIQLIADGVELHVVMRQADHRNIETTNRYVQHYFAGGIEQLQAKASEFGG
jgi:integrase